MGDASEPEGSNTEDAVQSTAPEDDVVDNSNSSTVVGQQLKRLPSGLQAQIGPIDWL